jgi:hypothetical protein
MAQFHILFGQNPEFAYLFLFLAVIIIVKYWPTPNTALHSFEPVSDRVDRTLSGDAVVPDTLAIPLTHLAEKARFGARFNVLYKLGVFGLPVAAAALIMLAMRTHNDAIQAAGVFCLFVWPIFSALSLYHYLVARHTLKKLAGVQTPELAMNLDGLTIPLLLIENGELVKARLKQGAADLHLSWKDIGKWVVYSDRSDLTTRVKGHYVFRYELWLDNSAAARGANPLCLRRHFTGEEEHKILAFVQKRMGKPVTFQDE